MPDQTPDASRPRPSDLPAVSRLAAGNALRERLKGRAGLGPVADAAAVFVAEFFAADTAAITLLKDDAFRTLVTVGDEVPGQVRHPDGENYPIDGYPTVTRLLRSGSGYVASIGNDGGVAESQRFLSAYRMSTCLAAPISYSGDVVGEVFAARVKGRPHFTGRELASLLDIARQVGYRIGPAVKAMDAQDPSWWFADVVAIDAAPKAGSPVAIPDEPDEPDVPLP